MRTTIKALGESALPPVWFATSLGITPPRTGTDEWLDTATEVLAYRTTYGITHELLPLGDKPDINNSARYHWHQELLSKLDRYTN